MYFSRKEWKSMKWKWIRSSFLTFSFVLITAIFYVHSLSKPVIKETIPLPEEINPTVQERANQLIQETAKKGITIVITDDFRSVEEQNQLYQQGRTSNGKIVTNAKGGESYHNFGLAIDFAIETPTSEIIWDMDYDGNRNGASDWMEVVKTAKTLGFEWGGDWEGFKDYPHLQMDFGLTIAELQSGMRPDEPSLSAKNVN